MKLGLLLIAMGFGYKVYAEASREKGGLRSIGQWVGAIMMAVSLVASATMIYAYTSGKYGECPFEKFGTFQMQQKVPAAK